MAETDKTCEVCGHEMVVENNTMHCPNFKQHMNPVRVFQAPGGPFRWPPPEWKK